MTYNIFISHAWEYNEDYKTIVKWLDNSNMDWRNMSIPEHNPKEADNNSELKQKIDNNINESKVFIAIAGMYAAQNTREWINIEIGIANKYNKPFIGIIPRGHERIPEIIKDSADKLVKWNSQSLIGAIKEF